ncbi:MAG TPA: DHHA1 domain-containing protein [archaeon]|nr:DHHA1 domain-containing protein [archaeon]
MLQGPLLEKFDSFVKSISQNDKVALVHDLDADGISSGAICYNAIKLMRGSAPDLIITQPYKTTQLLKESLAALKKKKINVLIVVDSAFDQSPDSVQAAEKIVSRILVIDHHKDYALKSKKALVVKPQSVSEIEPSKYPAAKFAFDLFSRHCDVQKWSWLACVGLMGDNQLLQWKDFVEQSASEHGTSIEELWKVAEVISAVETLAPVKLQKLMLFVAGANSPGEIINSEFAEYVSKLNSLTEKYMKEFKKKRVVYPTQDLVWFEFKAKPNIKSVLINKVSNEFFPDKTVMVVQDKGDGWLNFSARRQDFKVKTNDLLESAVLGMKGAGAGGHIPASAGRIRKRDLKEFKKRILAALASP